MLAIEVYKVEHRLVPDIINGIFGQRILSYEACNRSNFSTRAIKTTRYESETRSFLGPKIWELLPQNIKESENVNLFK